MADYLTTHGTAKLAGLNYVDAGQKGDPNFFGPNLRNLPLMASENLAINIAATRAFLHDCFSIQPTQEEYETMLAFNMMVPPKVRLGLSGRPLDVDDMLRSLRLPVLVTHGAEDKNSNLIAGRIHGEDDPWRQAFNLPRHWPLAFLRSHPALQRRACRLRAQRPERELTSPLSEGDPGRSPAH
jgi:hypothetical protein